MAIEALRVQADLGGPGGKSASELLALARLAQAHKAANPPLVIYADGTYEKLEPWLQGHGDEEGIL